MDAGPVDLRSDTVTRPTEEMRRAMSRAEVGDDVYGEDPTVHRLEERYAELVGKDAAVFVPSGTMANQIALRLLCPPGRTVLLGRRQHIVAYENGAGARNAGVQFEALVDDDGTLSPADVARAVAAAQHHLPTPGLICVENTHMPANGAPWDLAALDGVRRAGAGLPVHMDGARLFNASVATGIAPRRYAEAADTVMSCLSKGLAAPVGSLLAGPQGAMQEARALRAGFGGGMRQAGVIAAAGLVALDTMVERLAEDHHRARRLAEVVAERWPDSGCRPEAVPTNIVTFTHPDTAGLLSSLAAGGVRAGTIAPGVVRLVTHKDVDDDGLERACRVLASAP